MSVVRKTAAPALALLLVGPVFPSAAGAFVNCEKGDGTVVSVPRETCLRMGWRDLSSDEPLALFSEIPLVVEWEGQGAVSEARLRYIEQAPLGSMVVYLDQGRETCAGGYRSHRLGKGFWYLVCDDDRIAAGTFKVEQRGEVIKIDGHGKDELGRNIQFFSR